MPTEIEVFDYGLDMHEAATELEEYKARLAVSSVHAPADKTQPCCCTGSSLSDTSKYQQLQYVIRCPVTTDCCCNSMQAPMAACITGWILLHTPDAA